MLDIAERFWVKVAKTDVGCWEWLAFVNNQTGYGQFNISKRDPRLAHRVSYELNIGPIPPGLHIDHLCRNRSCVRPDHLEAVTQAENNRRAGPTKLAQECVAKTHCPHGHEYTDANTWVDHGRRRCRTCKREAQREYRSGRG